jgi:hypothetical protein
MTRAAGTHELKLWTGMATQFQPRDRRGRFVRVQHSPAQRAILSTAAMMRKQLGLPVDPRLTIRGKR